MDTHKNSAKQVKTKQGRVVLGSLLPTPKDKRDFNLGAIYGQIDIKTVPLTDWDIGEPAKYQKNQLDLDFCAGFMTSECSEQQEEEELSPLWQFAMTKFLMGDWKPWGADLRTAMLSAVKIGSVPQKLVNDYLNMKGALERDWYANWNNWPASWKNIALKYKKDSLFSVVGKYDPFDNVRAALWQFKSEKRWIAVGTLWHYNWDNVPGGIIPDFSEGNGEGHAIEVVGQKMFGREPRLKIKNHWGAEVGDNGFYYVGREKFNNEFSEYGLFMFKDLSKQVAQYLNENNLTISSAWFARIIVFLKNLFTLNSQS